MSSAVILATAGYDHKIRFWEAPTGVCSRSLRYPDSQVNCLQITPDKQFIAAAGNPHVRLFEVGGNANPNPVSAMRAAARSLGAGLHGGCVVLCASSPNHAHARGTARQVVSYEGHTGNVMALGFQRDGKWMYTCAYARLAPWSRAHWLNRHPNSFQSRRLGGRHHQAVGPAGARVPAQLRQHRLAASATGISISVRNRNRTRNRSVRHGWWRGGDGASGRGRLLPPDAPPGAARGGQLGGAAPQSGGSHRRGPGRPRAVRGGGVRGARAAGMASHALCLPSTHLPRPACGT